MSDSCETCGQYLSTDGNGKRRCFECEDVEKDDGEISHNKLVRCPHCRKTWEPAAAEQCEVFKDGDHSIWCCDCDKFFVVNTSVSYTFWSPEMAKEEQPK